MVRYKVVLLKNLFWYGSKDEKYIGIIPTLRKSQLAVSKYLNLVHQNGGAS